jgi:cell division protein FtsL
MRRYIILVGLIVLLALVHLYIFTRSIGLKYNIARLRIEFSRHYQENRKLNNWVARAESLDKVERVATGSLNMFYPEKINYIIITGEARLRQDFGGQGHD